MIRLTRLNKKSLVVNSDLIKFIENAPDTVITLTSGEKIVVLEKAEEVMSRIIEYRRQLRWPAIVVPPSDNSVEPLEYPDQPDELSDDEG